LEESGGEWVQIRGVTRKDHQKLARATRISGEKHKVLEESDTKNGSGS